MKVVLFFSLLLNSLPAFNQIDVSKLKPIQFDSSKIIGPYDASKRICLCCSSPGAPEKQPLFVVNDRVISQDQNQNLSVLNPSNIEKITLLKSNDPKAKKYGTKAKDGVIILELKK